MMNVWIAFLFLAKALSPAPANVEVIEFDIDRGRKVIGQLVAKKEVLGDKTIYTSKTEATISLLMKVHVEYHFEAEFQGEVLSRANAVIHVNGKQHVESFIQAEGDKYKFVKNEDNDSESKELDYPITYPAILLLFEEPDDVKKSFSEENGVFHQIQKVDDNTYEKINPKGKVNQYHYANGELEKAHLDAGLVQFTLLRK